MGIGSSRNPVDNLERLLEGLPSRVDQPEDEISLIGEIVRSEPDKVAIVSNAYCFTFRATDVKEVLADEVTACGDGHHRRVELVLASPCVLLGLKLWGPLEQATSGAARPFALSVRPRDLVVSANPEYQAREQEFLRGLPPLDGGQDKI